MEGDPLERLTRAVSRLKVKCEDLAKADSTMIDFICKQNEKISKLKKELKDEKEASREFKERVQIFFEPYTLDDGTIVSFNRQLCTFKFGESEISSKGFDAHMSRSSFFRWFIERVYITDEALSKLNKKDNKILLVHLAKSAIHLWNELADQQPLLQVMKGAMDYSIDKFLEQAVSARDEAKKRLKKLKNQIQPMSSSLITTNPSPMMTISSPIMSNPPPILVQESDIVQVSNQGLSDSSRAMVSFTITNPNFDHVNFSSEGPESTIRSNADRLLTMEDSD